MDVCDVMNERPVDVCDVMNERIGLDEDHMKNMDASGGCERSLVQFFSKRVSCSCLDKRVKELKSHSRTALCCHCRQRKAAKSMTICASCKAKQYCSRECQVADWPQHKQFCRNRSSGALCFSL